MKGSPLRAEIYPISDCPFGLLAIMPRPRGGDWLDDEMASMRQQGLDVVVSLLVDEEINELGLVSEPESCTRSGLQFIRFPISDRGVPMATPAFSELVSSLVAELRAGHGLGIHCRIGIGRSALLAVCVLGRLGIPLETAWEMVQRSRRLIIPDTAEQRAWPGEWLANLQSG